VVIEMLKKLTILLGCFSLLLLVACRDEAGNPAYEGEAEDVSLETSPDNGSMIDPEDAEIGNPAYEGEAEDVSLETSRDNGLMIDSEDAEIGNRAYEGEAEDISRETSSANGSMIDSEINLDFED
jgi:hypothetical protein